MDSSVFSIITAAFFDVLLFIGLFYAFLFYRKIRSPVIQVDLDIDLRRPYMHEGEYGFLELAKKVKDMSLDEVYSAIGEWGFIYLTLHKYIAYTFAILSVLGCSILLVVYYYGDTEVDDTFHTIGISHIIEQPGFLVAPIIFLFVFTGIMYAFAHYYYIVSTYSECDDLHPPQKYFVHISKLPRQFPPEFMNDQVKSILVSKYGEGVISVYTIPYYEIAYKYYLKLEEYEQKLKFYEKELNDKGVEPSMWTKDLKKVNAIEYCKSEIVGLQEKIRDNKETGIHTNSGHAYVACKNQMLVKEIIEFRIERQHELLTEQWRFKGASNPTDIIWKNVGHPRTLSLLQKIFYNGIFVALFLALLTPAFLNSLILDFFESINAAELIGGIVGVYLPSLLMLVFQQIILPEAVEFLVEREKHTNRHSEVTSGLQKYLFYLIFYIFLYPLLGLRFVELIGIFVDSDVDWEEEFAESINSTGQFFTIFMVHETFVKNGWDLMVTGKYFKSKAKALIATTEEDKARAYQAEFFKFDLELAISTNALIISTSFCVVYPLILIPALTFFTMRVICN